MFTHGDGMVFFDFLLMLLSAGASITSFAAYRSQSVAGDELADHVRAIKAVAYAVAFLFVMCMLVETGDAPITGPTLVVLSLLAFSDIVASLARIGARLQVEQEEARRRPATIAHHR